MYLHPRSVSGFAPTGREPDELEMHGRLLGVEAVVSTESEGSDAAPVPLVFDAVT